MNQVRSLASLGTGRISLVAMGATQMAATELAAPEIYSEAPDPSNLASPHELGRELHAQPLHDRCGPAGDASREERHHAWRLASKQMSWRVAPAPDEAAVEKLIAILSSSYDFQAKNAALGRLAKLKRSMLVKHAPSIAHAIENDTHAGVQYTAIRVLSELDQTTLKAYGPLLVKVAQGSPHSHVRMCAMMAMRSMRAVDLAEHAQAIAKLFKSKMIFEQERALDLLERLPAKDLEKRALSIAGLFDSEDCQPEMRRRLAALLSKTVLAPVVALRMAEFEEAEREAVRARSHPPPSSAYTAGEEAAAMSSRAVDVA